MRLRAVEFEDIDLIYRWENDQSLWYLTETQRPFSRETIRSYVESTQGYDIYDARQLRLMIEAQGSKEAVGCIDLFDFEPQNRKAAAGILIDEAHRRQGYALAALESLQRYAFEVLSIHNLYAFIPQGNEASCRLFEKAGFKQTALLQDWIFRQGEYHNMRLFQCFATL